MVIADLDVACHLCKHPQIQRFYHATPYHTLTCSTFQKIVESVAQKTGYECENCGEQVGPASAHRGTVTLGCPDDSGLIRGYWEQGKPLAFAFTPQKRLDPQELPGFEPPSNTVPTLTEAAVLSALGRVLSVKRVWRALLEDWQRDPEGGAEMDVCPGMTLYVDADIDSLNDVEGIITLHSSGTNRAEWITHNGAALGATVDITPIIDAIQRTFEVGQVTYTFSAEDPVFRAITTPQGIVYDGELDVGKLAERTVAQGMTPGDCGRFCAEEVIGTLLRVWKPVQGPGD